MGLLAKPSRRPFHLLFVLAAAVLCAVPTMIRYQYYYYLDYGFHIREVSSQSLGDTFAAPRQNVDETTSLSLSWTQSTSRSPAFPLRQTRSSVALSSTLLVRASLSHSITNTPIVTASSSSISVPGATQTMSLTSGRLNATTAMQNTCLISSLKQYSDSSDALPLNLTYSTPNAVRINGIGGLGNRIRVLLSYQYARNLRQPLHFFWIADSHCTSSFRELFVDPPADLLVFDAIPPNVTVNATTGMILTYSIVAFGPLALKTLHPRKELQTRIDCILKLLNQGFTAVHIRRTDFVSNYSLDSEFATWALSGRGSKYAEPIYAAADNPKSLETFSNSVWMQEPQRLIVTCGAQFLRGEHIKRLTSTDDAIVDLWVASHARRFCGTYFSSYSDFIESLRVARGAALPGERNRGVIPKWAV